MNILATGKGLALSNLGIFTMNYIIKILENEEVECDTVPHTRVHFITPFPVSKIPNYIPQVLYGLDSSTHLGSLRAKLISPLNSQMMTEKLS